MKKNIDNSSFAVTAKLMKQLEHMYFDEYAMTARSLMNVAGLEIARRVSEKNFDKICVVCGRGNNGGDGYTAALYLLREGFDVTVVSAGEPKSDDAKFFYAKYKETGGSVLEHGQEGFDCILKADCLIDAIFGYGFHGIPRGAELNLIEQINKSDAFVVSVDIPSGCNADTAEYDVAVKADMTVALGFLKGANVSYPAYELCGEVVLADIGLPSRIADIAYKNRYITMLNENTVQPLLPSRGDNTHKGSFGTLALYCGSENMTGAARLAAESALRCGVGLVKLVGDEKTLGYLKPSLTEPVYEIISDTPTKANAYVVGCGFGRNRDELLKTLLPKLSGVLCLDADGINFAADNINVLNKITAEKVLTPHPAEMARLIGKTTDFVQKHRLNVAAEFAKQYSLVLVLKGARTVVATPDALYVNTSGSSALAKGGSGDVLAGMIGAFLARGLTTESAAAISVYLHGKAGQRCAIHKGEDSVLPSELLVNGL